MYFKNIQDSRDRTITNHMKHTDENLPRQNQLILYLHFFETVFMEYTLFLYILENRTFFVLTNSDGWILKDFLIV